MYYKLTLGLYELVELRLVSHWSRYRSPLHHLLGRSEADLFKINLGPLVLLRLDAGIDELAVAAVVGDDFVDVPGGKFERVHRHEPVEVVASAGKAGVLIRLFSHSLSPIL